MSGNKIRRWIIVGLTTLIAVVATHNIDAILNFSSYPLSPNGAAVAQGSSGVPSESTMCLPTDLSEDELSRANLIGEHQGEHSLFAIWELQQAGNTFLFANSFYGGDGGVCGHAFDSRYELSMSPEYIQQADARALAILLYEHRIDKAGGLANFQALIDEALAEPGPSYFAPEFIYAMRQLGVNLPAEEIQAIEPGNEPPRSRQP